MIPFLNPLLQNCTEIFTITQSRHGARMKIPKISSAICIIVRFKSNSGDDRESFLGMSVKKTGDFLKMSFAQNEKKVNKQYKSQWKNKNSAAAVNLCTRRVAARFSQKAKIICF